MRETSALKRLFEYKAWANGEMLTAMEQLELGAPTTEIAIRTLTHTLIVDQIFAAHMSGTGHGHDSENAAAAPSLAELSKAIRASDRGLINYVSGLDDATLAERIDFTFTDGAPGRMSRDEMLMHLIIHGGLHRGQIGWIMALEGAATPADGYTGYLHTAHGGGRRIRQHPRARPASRPKAREAERTRR